MAQVGSWQPCHADYLVGHGDSVNRLILGILGILLWLIGRINLLTESP